MVCEGEEAISNWVAGMYVYEWISDNTKENSHMFSNSPKWVECSIIVDAV
jgi:hypothetical protein